MASKPRWCLGMLGTQRRVFGNIVGHVKGVDDMSSLGAWTAQQFDPSLNWGDVEWIKKRWGGKLILKGVMDPIDARLARDSGADALVVSLGFDASKDEPLNALSVTEDGFARAGAAIGGLRLPAAIVQEGGYNVDVLGPLLTRFLTGFGGR